MWIQETAEMHERRDEFLSLFLQNQSSLWVVVLAGGVPSHEAEDVVQQLALLLWENFDRFETGSNFRAWAFSFARNLVKRHHAASARAARVRPLPDDVLDELVALEAQGHANLVGDRIDHLQCCLQLLQPDARQLITWRYGDRLSFEDLAAKMGRSCQALRTKLCRIRAILRDCIELRMRQATQP
jgi:RNA polymerase sigma-70 factor (ECF subfamily)